MANSQRWKDLTRDVMELRNQFLPDPFDPLGMYADSARVQAHARAFLVLSHAEFETFLESWAKEIARTCEQVWLSHARVTEPLAFLIGSSAIELRSPESLGGALKDSPQQLKDALIKAFHRFYKLIVDNNGIKEKNVLALFSPLGIPEAALAGTLLPDLDAFGALRGEHAHHAARAVPSVLDPELVHKKAMALIAALSGFDEWLMEYKGRIR